MTPMKIYRDGNIEYWYDRSTRCWWCREVDEEGNQVGTALDAYEKKSILLYVDQLKNERNKKWERLNSTPDVIADCHTGSNTIRHAT